MSTPGVEVDSQSIAGLFLASARKAPTRGLFRHVGGLTISYGEACIRAVDAATQLASVGIKRGDCVVCYLEDTIPSALFSLAAIAAGVIPVPLGPVFSIRHLKALLERVGNKPVFTTRAHAPKVLEAGLQPMCFRESGIHPDAISLTSSHERSLEEALGRFEAAVREVSSDDVFMIQPTSGSTGEPKLVLRKHRGFTRYAKFVGRELRAQEAPPTFLAVAALTHAFGLHMFTTALSLGGELCVPNNIDTNASLDEVRELNPTVLPLTPRVLRSFYRQYLAKTRSAGGAIFGPAATTLLTAGGKCDPEHLRFVESQGIDTVEFYGSSEASIVALTPRGARREGCAGRIVPDCNVRVEADGELLVQSPGLMRGYFLDEALTRDVMTADGHYRTGDLASVSDDNYLRILGRKRDLFNTPDGSNIYPERIETAIEGIPWVRQAMLVGDGRPYLSVLIVVEGEFDIEKPGRLPTDKFELLYDDIGRAIARINTGLERVERVVCFSLLGHAFDADCYAVVGPGKVRRGRKEFLARYAAEIARLYADDLPRESPMLVPPRERRFQPEARASGSSNPPPSDPGRRRWARVAAQMPITIVADGKATIGQTENLSLGGARIRTDERWAPGSQVEVNLTSGGVQFVGHARIVYHHSEGVALEFLSVEGESVAPLIRILAEKGAIPKPSDRRILGRVETTMRVVLSSSDGDKESRAKNISINGILIESDPQYREGTEVMLAFPEHLAWSIPATIVCHRANGLFIAFSRLKDSERQDLERLLVQLSTTKHAKDST